MVDGLTVWWEEVLEFVGSKVCLNGTARHAICAQISSTEQVLGEMTKRIGFITAPGETALEHRENHHPAGFSVELERVDDGERQT